MGGKWHEASFDAGGRYLVCDPGLPGFLASIHKHRVGAWMEVCESDGLRHITGEATEDLKLGKFTHADAGQMHLYLN